VGISVRMSLRSWTTFKAGKGLSGCGPFRVGGLDLPCCHRLRAFCVCVEIDRGDAEIKTHSGNARLMARRDSCLGRCAAFQFRADGKAPGRKQLAILRNGMDPGIVMGIARCDPRPVSLDPVDRASIVGVQPGELQIIIRRKRNRSAIAAGQAQEGCQAVIRLVLTDAEQ